MNKDQRPYLNDLLKRTEMIRDFTVDGRDAFMDTPMIQESVIRCFEVIGEIIKRLPPAMLTTYPHIPWRQIAGFRDVLIHNYDRIDLDVVWQAIEDDIEPLEQAINAMLNDLDVQNNESANS